jgi:hypothetical protein
MNLNTFFKNALVVSNFIKRSKLLGTYLNKGRMNRIVNKFEIQYDHNGIPYAVFKKKYIRWGRKSKYKITRHESSRKF